MKISITTLNTYADEKTSYLVNSKWELNDKITFVPSFDADTVENISHMELHETRFYITKSNQQACIFRYE